MEYKEKIAREKQLINLWDEIKLNKKDLADVILFNRDVKQIDFILFFQCMALVLENLEVNEEEIKKAPDKIEIDDIDEKLDTIFAGFFKNVEKVCGKDLRGEIECFLTYINDSKPINERVKAIEKIRMLAWKNLFNMKNDISVLMERYPQGSMETEDFMLIFKCVSMILLELDLKDQYNEILEKLKFI